jgi:hypothetical protein
MSYITGTQNELLYSSIGSGTALGTFTTEDNLQKTLAPVIIPAGFFYNAGATGKSLRIVARGKLGTTGAPTFTWSLRLLTSTTWSAGGLLLGSTAATTAATTVTGGYWQLEADVILRTLSIGGASTVITEGLVSGPASLASPFASSIPATNGTPTLATLDNSTTYYLFLSAACGTSSGSNTIQLDMLKVYGEN